MELLTGEFNVTLDEKGRISLPAHLRRILNEAELSLTQCKEDGCLWLFPTSEFKQLLKKINSNTNLLTREDRHVKRRFFTSLPVKVDKAGRIQIDQNLREFAGLEKNCIVLGQGDYIEIWDEQRYNTYLDESENDFKAASNKLGGILKNSGGAE